MKEKPLSDETVKALIERAKELGDDMSLDDLAVYIMAVKDGKQVGLRKDEFGNTEIWVQ